jgi:hypothetical protein
MSITTIAREGTSVNPHIEGDEYEAPIHSSVSTQSLSPSVVKVMVPFSEVR